ncbi:MAG: primosomal protein N' [Pseudomonadota bacterium]
MTVARVALDVPLHGLFDYAVPQGMAVAPGQRVCVPFGRRTLVGIVLECAAQSEMPPEQVKPLHAVLPEGALPAEVLRLLQFCNEYYRYPIGPTVLAALPTRLRSAEPFTVPQVRQFALTPAGQTLDLETLPKRKQVQRRLLQAMQSGVLSEAQARGLSASALPQLRELIDAGWVAQTVQQHVPAAHRLCGAHDLTPAQQTAVSAVVQQAGFGAFLLHGVTGSGKTEVYVHLMHAVLQRGGQVLLLVPEINLTPQLEQYFRSRFPDTELVSLHSGLADGLRAENWLKAADGTARIVLGTRLAVFTPLPQLALMIVDEEHDASFKQQDGLRYSARDMAVIRASQRGVAIVLGSATPSLESWHNAQTGRYRLLSLPERANAQAQLPAVRCINLNQVAVEEGVSAPLLTAIEARMARGEQSLLFINRRGYAPVLMCTACGWLSACPHCAGKLVLHLQERRLRCHHCGHQQRVPHSCPSCGNVDLHPVGSGTQRIESVLQVRLPQARILRIDRDSTRNKGAWSDMRRQIEAGEVDVLVGTQMLAKGHDFPNLTLVGVLNPDGALYSSDFRAPERLYAQLAQVAGRAGRADKPGEVLVQTAFPDHPLFRALAAHDFPGWADTLLGERQAAGFPPFVYQAMLRAEAKQGEASYGFLRQARDAALQFGGEVEVYGVVPAAMPRRANHIRVQLLVQAASRKALQHFLQQWQPVLDDLPAKNLRWSLDIDPLEF